MAEPRAAGREDTPGERILVIPTHKGLLRISYADILYLENIERKICVTLKNGEKKYSKQIRCTFFSQIEPLLQDLRFVRPHQSFVVNLDYATGITAEELVLEGGAVIPVSKKRRKETTRHYNAYASGREYVCLSERSEVRFLEDALDCIGLGAAVYSGKDASSLRLCYISRCLPALVGTSRTRFYEAHANDSFLPVCAEDAQSLRGWMQALEKSAQQPIRYRACACGGQLVHAVACGARQNEQLTVYTLFFPADAAEARAAPQHGGGFAGLFITESVVKDMHK